jgi:hypothetical protein
MAEEGWEKAGGKERGVVTHSSGQFCSAVRTMCLKEKRELI